MDFPTSDDQKISDLPKLTLAWNDPQFLLRSDQNHEISPC